MRYNTIKLNDIANGDGIGISLYTQGCPHHCKGCFNEETWNFDGGKEFTKKERDLILNNLNINGIKRHLSILGGEPFCEQNAQGVLDLCKFIKEKSPTTKIYIWTGYFFEEIVKKYDLANIDVIVDGLFVKSKEDLTLKMRGSSNQRVIDVYNTINQNKIITLNV